MSARPAAPPVPRQDRPVSADYGQFGAVVAGVLDGYVGSDTASPVETLSVILDFAAECGVTVGVPETHGHLTRQGHPHG